MSVIVMGRMAVDPAAIEKLWAERADDFLAIKEEAVAAGAMSHRWGASDGEMWLLDEWPDAGSFQAFFSSQPKIAELMGAAGVTAPPEFTIIEARSGPDEF